MSYENPTPLRVGATGTLNGWRVSVAGRLVMGVQEDGETYFWNEYHLVDDSGNSAMLVFEETEDGPEWKLFREFTPSQPMSTREAATKRIGDNVTLDDTPTRVTLVGASRVFHIEGRAPEGVEEGDIASYFNVDTGSRMLVASWTGDEIEFYEGLDAPAAAVAEAFGFSSAAASPSTPSVRASFSGGSSDSFRPGGTAASSAFTKIVLIALGGAVLFAAYSCFSGSRSPRSSASASRPQPPPRQAAPPVRLATGAQGSLAQHRYVVDGHAVVAVARVSGQHERREYVLRDEASEAALLLVNGLSGGSKEWHLLHPVPAPSDLTPYDAAAKRRGASVNVDGRTAHIVELFQSKAISTDGPAGGPALSGAVQYGFVAREASDWLVARWTENQIQFHRGSAVPEAEVLAALGRTPEKAK